jgi:hypothetical protein
MLRRVALVRTAVSEELSASFIRLTRIGELGTTLAVTSNRRTARHSTVFAEVWGRTYMGWNNEEECTKTREKTLRNDYTAQKLSRAEPMFHKRNMNCE